MHYFQLNCILLFLIAILWIYYRIVLFYVEISVISVFYYRKQCIFNVCITKDRPPTSIVRNLLTITPHYSEEYLLLYQQNNNYLVVCCVI